MLADHVFKIVGKDNMKLLGSQLSIYLEGLVVENVVISIDGVVVDLQLFLALWCR